MAEDNENKKEKNPPIVINIGSLVGKVEISGEVTKKQLEEIKTKVQTSLIEALSNIR
jgi:hypothetical protein